MFKYFKSRSPRHRATRANNPAMDLLTGREAIARHLYSEQCFNSKLDMLEYDNSPALQGGWLAEADRRLGSRAVEIGRTTQEDITIAHAWGMNLIQWHSLTDFERANCRRNVRAAS